MSHGTETETESSKFTPETGTKFSKDEIECLVALHSKMSLSTFLFQFLVTAPTRNRKH